MADILTTDEGIGSPQMGGAQAGAANAVAAREARKTSQQKQPFVRCLRH